MSKIAGCFLSLFLGVCLAQPAIAQIACTLIGHRATIDVAGAVTGNATVVVQPGIVEFNPAPGSPLISVDVQGGTIRLFNNTMVPWSTA